MNVKGYIFDLDGVIVDTAVYHYLSWQKLAHHLGFEFKEEQNEEMKGISRMDSLDVILSIGGLKKSSTEKIALAEQKNSWYLEFLEELSINNMLPGVKSFFDELKAEGLPLALGSASKNARFVISKLRIESYFDAIVDGNDVTHSKPDPEVFIKAAAFMNLEPSEVVVFEDSYKGVVAANEGGFISCGVGDPSILTNANFTIGTFENLNLSDLQQKIGQSRSHEKLSI